MPHGGVNNVPLTAQAKRAEVNIPMPGGKLPQNDMKRQEQLVPMRSLGTSCTSIAGVATCGSFAPA